MNTLQNYKIISHPVIIKIFWKEINWAKTQVLCRCEEILSTVERWKEWKIKAINSVETNREHILWMLDLVFEFHDELSNLCDVEELIMMILIHDLWEYRIWDISKSEEGAEQKKKIQKKYEKRVATILINQISDTELREKCLSLLERYFEFWITKDQPIEDLDRLYLITKFFDTVQWLEYGIVTVFRENYKTNKIEVRNHLRNNFQEISNISAFLDASVLSSAKTNYESLEWQEREQKKREQQENLETSTGNGIYQITNTVSHRIKQEIEQNYDLELMADFWKLIDFFWDYPEKSKKEA